MPGVPVVSLFPPLVLSRSGYGSIFSGPFYQTTSSGNFTPLNNKKTCHKNVRLFFKEGVFSRHKNRGISGKYFRFCRRKAIHFDPAHGQALILSYGCYEKPASALF